MDLKVKVQAFKGDPKVWGQALYVVWRQTLQMDREVTGHLRRLTNPLLAEQSSLQFSKKIRRRNLMVDFHRIVPISFDKSCSDMKS